MQQVIGITSLDNGGIGCAVKGVVLQDFGERCPREEQGREGGRGREKYESDADHTWNKQDLHNKLNHNLIEILVDHKLVYIHAKGYVTKSIKRR